MMADNKKRITFVVATYSLFWIMILITGVVMMLAGEGLHTEIMMVICAWAPTFALFILFKKLYPDSTIKRFYRNSFKEHLNFKLIAFITSVQVLVFICTFGITAFSNAVSLNGLLDLSFKTIVLGFIMTLIQGATGEESGWRGFLQPSLEKKYGVIKTSFIVGLIWGFWHIPLWLTSGYAGIELLRYIVAFMISIMSTSIIIGVCYSRCKNLFVPIWIHFMFNFGFTVFAGDESYVVDLLFWIAAFYVLVAVGYVVWHKRSKTAE